MKFTLTIIFFLLAEITFACSCSSLDQFSIKDIEKTDYIALVKINQILPVNTDSANNSGPFRYFKIVIEEIEHYKGKRLTELMVYGGHPKVGFWTSCDFDMNENQEWLIFGQNNNDQTFVYPCWRTVIYRQSDGLRDWQYKRGFEELDFLNNFYQKKENVSATKDGELKIFYPNNKLEKVEHFTKGNLDGKVNYFYPNGSIYGELNFRKGILHGSSIWYYEDSKISNIDNYKKGIKVDSSIYYAKAGKVHYPMYISVYNKKGIRVLLREFGTELNKPNKKYISHEIVYDPKLKKEKSVYYYDNGNVMEIIYKLNGINWGEFFHYDRNGKLLRYWKYDKNGNPIK